MADIFISYARSDRARAQALAKALEQKGYSVWWDPKIPPGKTFDEVIEEALDSARCVVVLWSKDSVSSEWVRTEAAEGKRRGILVPALIDNVTIPLAFRLRQAADLTDWEKEKPHSEFDSMIEAIAGIVGRSTAEEPSEAEPKVYLEEEFTNSIGMKFVLIEAETFMMGSPPDDKYRSEDEHQHKVTISKPFYLQTTQVTQGQWKSLMGDNPSRFKDCGDTCPVENVSWDDAQQFIMKLNQKENTDKYRLPAEAEWEYACRARSTTRFCFGDSEDQLGEYAWSDANSERKTHPVGRKKPNAWGLYDMHGNVWEWCEDRYGDYPTGHVTDPKGSSSGAFRVLRGGSWCYGAGHLRSAYRGSRRPDLRNHHFGFRVARAL